MITILSFFNEIHNSKKKIQSGSGNLGSAIAKGLINKHVMTPKNLFLTRKHINGGNHEISGVQGDFHFSDPFRFKLTL